MIILSEKLDMFLKKQGWNPNNIKDIKETLEVLKSKNYPIFPKLIEFLESFDNSQFTFSYENEQNNEIVCFDCKKYIELESGAEEIYEKSIGEKLVIIGENNYNYLFMMSLSGKIYGCSFPYIFLVGNNLEEAFINLLEGSKLIEIPLIVDKCPFTNEIYHIKSSELEIYKQKFNDSFIMEIDGRKCKKWGIYTKELLKQLKTSYFGSMPKSKNQNVDTHAFYIIEADKEFEFTDEKRKAYLLIINDFAMFLRKDLKNKEQFELMYKHKILNYFDDQIVKSCIYGEYKKFNVLLVD